MATNCRVSKKKSQRMMFTFSVILEIWENVDQKMGLNRYVHCGTVVTRLLQLSCHV